MISGARSATVTTAAIASRAGSAAVDTATSMSTLVFCLSISTLEVRATTAMGLRWVAAVVLAATAGLSVAPLGYAQERLPGGGVAVGAGLGPVAAWYGRPTMRYGHGVLGDAIEGGSLVVLDPGGRQHEVVLQDRFVFEDITPRLADLDSDGELEIITIRSDVQSGAAVAIYALDGGRLVERAATEPIGQPNRWLSIAAIADFTGDGRPEIAVVRTPHIGGVLEILSLRERDLVRIYPQADGYSTHVIGSRDTSFAAAADVSGDGVADLLLPNQSRRSLVALSLVSGIETLAIIETPARIAGPIGVDGAGLVQVPLETGQVFSVDFR